MTARKTGRILTVRLSSPLDRRLRAQARVEKRSESELVRELLETGLERRVTGEEPTIGQLAGHLFGIIDDPTLPNGRDARKHLRKWKPDRRG